MIQVSDEKEIFHSNFEKYQVRYSSTHPAWLRKMSQEAWLLFERQGFPSTGEEEWQFTNLAPMLKVPFQSAPSTEIDLSSLELEATTFGNWAASRLVFVNGHFSERLSRRGNLPTRAMVTPLSESWEKHGCLLEKHLGKQTELVGHPFAALNTAFLSEGTLVYLPKGVVLEEPLHLVFVGSANSNPLSCHPRILIVAEENSQARIVETYLGAGTGAYFTNPVTELIAGDNAILEHYKLQMENLNAFHLAHLQVRLGRDSNVTLHSISLGGALVRNDLNVVLDGEGGEATLNGFYFAGGTQLVDNHTRIRHEKPHCNSHELYKGILDGKARGVFSGRIYVHPGAQKTDSKQTNKNLLLSDEALVNTIPQLEIYADDVKCTHGATIGQLDADSVFYLRSRGIGLAEARELLTYAFASDLTGRIRIPAIREGLEKQLFRHFSTGNTELEVL